MYMLVNTNLFILFPLSVVVSYVEIVILLISFILVLAKSKQNFTGRCKFKFKYQNP